MKTIQLALVALTIILLTACGGSSKKNDAHVHGDDCSQTHDSKSHTREHEQESFTVEADSLHNHETEELKKSEPRPHKHGDGKTHTH
jgi:outer membrane biogenesis lipoprotein LolB